MSGFFEVEFASGSDYFVRTRPFDQFFIADSGLTQNLEAVVYTDCSATIFRLGFVMEAFCDEAEVSGDFFIYLG